VEGLVASEHAAKGAWNPLMRLAGGTSGNALYVTEAVDSDETSDSP